jgi:hypothetical protein
MISKEVARSFKVPLKYFVSTKKEILLRTPHSNRNYVCEEWFCVQESEKCEKYSNKLSVRLHHVDFLWSLQIFLPSLLCFFGTTL